MALLKEVLFKGITVTDAYITAVAPTIHVGNTRMSFAVIYSVQAGEAPFDNASYECPYSLEGANPVEQAYTFLKTLPEFEGCVDC